MAARRLREQRQKRNKVRNGVGPAPAPFLFGGKAPDSGLVRLAGLDGAGGAR
ncbi:hypothetical protein AZA_61751 [Nitrospirillum viridazoti Y2]|nr:hypothetical protein AZA_61751 [Nitrospirillum amazonense Y2]